MDLSLFICFLQPELVCAMSEGLLEAGLRAQAKFPLKYEITTLPNSQARKRVTRYPSAQVHVLLFCSGWTGTSDTVDLMPPRRGPKGRVLQTPLLLAAARFCVQKTTNTTMRRLWGRLTGSGGMAMTFAKAQRSGTAFRMVFLKERHAKSLSRADVKSLSALPSV